MALETHDLARELEALSAQATAGTAALTLSGFEALLVHVPAGERYEHDAPAPATMLVLEGIGTVAIDDWRATLAGGHLAGVPAHSRLIVTADAGRALNVLVTRAAPTPAAEPPRPAAAPGT